MNNIGKIIRSNKIGGSHYTPISNEILQSKILNPDQKSVLVHLLSLPEDWIIYKGNIWKSMNIGRDKFNNAWAELVKLGYIVSTKLKDKNNNLLKGYNHIVYEDPVKPNSDLLNSDLLNSGITEIQLPRKPVTIQSNIEQSNNKQSNNFKNILDNNIAISGPVSGTSSSIFKDFEENPIIDGESQDKGPIAGDINEEKEISIEDIQSEYYNSGVNLYEAKNELINAAKLCKNVINLVENKDFTSIERRIGPDKFIQVKPMINKYLKNLLLCNSYEMKLQYAMKKKDSTLNPNDSELFCSTI